LVKDLNLRDRVIFLGKQDKVSDYLAIFDIFALSSIFEGIPLVILEAMYMQVPVVATDTGGVSEVIVNDQNGILVEVNNADSISGAIIELLNDKTRRKRLALSGQETAIKQFGIERYMSRLEGLYTELCKKHV